MRTMPSCFTRRPILRSLVSPVLSYPMTPVTDSSAPTSLSGIPDGREGVRSFLLPRLLTVPPLLPATEPFHEGPSDFDLNPQARTELLAGPGGLPAPKLAAVLVPLIVRDTVTVLLTQRTEHLKAHAGQIAFPGGKVEDGDQDPIDTALREAEEEIGLSRALVEPLGYLDAYRSGTGFRITPVVGLVDPEFSVVPDPREVASVFEVPLAFLMDRANHQLHTRTLGGRDRHFYAMPYGERFIWGVTAGILRNMHERLFGS